MSPLIDVLTARAEALGERRARHWAKALVRDARNPARGGEDGRLTLSTPDAVDSLLTRPWLNWPTPDPLRRRA